MSALDQAHFAMLQKLLETDFVSHLPPLLDHTKPAEEQNRKNLSRAFAAFAVSKICGIGAVDTAKAVVDDFDDFGIDATVLSTRKRTPRIDCQFSDGVHTEM
jgi:hypothetical protein